jgi:hypothetical protein
MYWLDGRHRQQAGSYRGMRKCPKLVGHHKIKCQSQSQSEAACQPTCLFDRTHSSVGASLLAMDANDNAGNLDERVAHMLFAGKPAPTGICVRF